MMRVRYSLRAFLLLPTLAAAICAWCVAPSIAARKFVSHLAKDDFRAADKMFRDAGDECLQKWNNELWSFRATGDLFPVSFGQLITGRRTVRLQLSHFAFDQTVSREMLIAVTPLGANTPNLTTEQYSSIVIERNEDARRLR